MKKNKGTGLPAKANDKTAGSLPTDAELYRSFFDDAPIGKSMTTPDGLVIRVNEAFCKMLGYSADEMKGRHFAEFTHPDDLAKSQEGVQSLITGECDVCIVDKRYIAKNGDIKWAHVTTRLHRDAAGTPVILLTHIQDITDRRIAEEKLRRSEERIEKILENSETGYFFIDYEGRFRQVNSAWLRLHKYESAEEILGRHFSVTQVEADLAQAQATVDKMLAGKRVLTGEFSRRCKDGSVGYHSFSANPVFENGKIAGLEGFLIDITERKRAEAALQEKDKKLREQNELLQQRTAALRELIVQLKTEQKSVEEQVGANIDQLIRPMLRKAGETSQIPKIKGYLEIIDQNLRGITSSFGSVIENNWDSLTQREVEVSQMVREGLSSKRIAELLGIAYRSVTAHRRNIRRKLGLTTRKINLPTYLRKFK